MNANKHGNMSKIMWFLDFSLKDQIDLFEDILIICEKKYHNLKKITSKILFLLNSTSKITKCKN